MLAHCTAQRFVVVRPCRTGRWRASREEEKASASLLCSSPITGSDGVIGKECLFECEGVDVVAALCVGSPLSESRSSLVRFFFVCVSPYHVGLFLLSCTCRVGRPCLPFSLHGCAVYVRCGDSGQAVNTTVGRPLPHAPRSSPPRRRCRGAVRSRPPSVTTGEGEGEGHCFVHRWGGATEEKGGADLTVESEIVCHCATERDVTKHENKEVMMECSAVGALISSYLHHVYAISCRVIAGSPTCDAPRSLSLPRVSSCLLGFSGLQEGFDLSHVTPRYLYGARDRGISPTPTSGDCRRLSFRRPFGVGCPADCAIDAAAASSHHGAAVTAVHSCNLWLIGLFVTLKDRLPMRLTLPRALLRYI